jgi:hypothetical protein
MTEGGLTAKQMAEVRKQVNILAREHTAMMYRAAGYQTKNQGQRNRRKASAA